MRSKPEISFLVAGSSKSAASAVQKTKESGAYVFYRETSTSDELATAIRESSLTLSGLLGTTIASQNVIPNQAYQSLACAVTVIIAQNEAPSALFVDKDTVLLVGPEDVPALVKVINWAANNRQTLVDIGRNGRHLYDRMFSQSFVDSELSKIVDDLS
jgi:glycosyltransferase involved in cell wall biosynthesis